jgi:photosystem II stability/assembly factor-like uncharacterized protein
MAEGYIKLQTQVIHGYHRFQGVSGSLNSISALDSNNLVCYGDGGKIIKTTNGGLQWNSLNSITGGNLYGINYVNDNILYSCSISGQIIKSTDSGNNWLFTTSGSISNLYDSYFLNSQTGFAIGNGGLLKTTNSGDNWNLVSEVCTGRGIYFTDYNTGYAVGGGILKTTDSGFNWFYLESGISSSFYSVFFLNSNTGYATTLGKVVFTTNSGNNWIIQNPPVQGQVQDIYFINFSTGFIVTGNGQILKTTNSGNLWNVVFQSPSGMISHIDFSDENTGYATGGFNLMKTTNSGDSWSLIPIIINANSVDFINTSTGYIGGLYIIPDYGSIAAVCKTTNGGLNWKFEYTGLNLNITSILALNSDTCYITGFGGAILRTTTGGDPNGVHSKANEIAKLYYLFQNYPNPFNPSTKIKFDLPAGDRYTNVSLKVYSVLGNEVTTLVNEQLKAGTYEVEWDASNYASGVYYYKLIATDYTETKKMVLLK